MTKISKYTVVLQNTNETATFNDIFAPNPSMAINKADPKRRYKKCIVYQDGKEIKTITRL